MAVVVVELADRLAVELTRGPVRRAGRRRTPWSASAAGRSARRPPRRWRSRAPGRAPSRMPRLLRPWPASISARASSPTSPPASRGPSLALSSPQAIAFQTSSGESRPGSDRRPSRRWPPQMPRRPPRSAPAPPGRGDVAEVVGVGDAQPREVARVASAAAVVAAERREAEGSSGSGPAITARARRSRGWCAQAARNGSRQPARAVRGAGDQSVGGLEPDRAAEGCRNADRATAVGAERQVADSERQRAGRAARAAPAERSGAKGLPVWPIAGCGSCRGSRARARCRARGDRQAASSARHRPCWPPVGVHERARAAVIG